MGAYIISAFNCLILFLFLISVVPDFVVLQANWLRQLIYWLHGSSPQEYSSQARQQTRHTKLKCFPNRADSIRMSCCECHVVCVGLCVLLRVWESDSQFAQALNVMLLCGCVENVCLCINVWNWLYFFLLLYCSQFDCLFRTKPLFPNAFCSRLHE